MTTYILSSLSVLCPGFVNSAVLLQVWNEEDPEDEVLAMVVRTGLCTTMGSMLRQVMNPLQDGIAAWATDPFLPVSSLAIWAVHPVMCLLV